MKDRLRPNHVHIRTRESIYQQNRKKVIYPGKVLQTLLTDFCKHNRNKVPRYTTFSRSPKFSDLDLAGKLLDILGREEEADHVVAVVGKLNVYCERHALGSELAGLLGRFFSMYEQYRVHFSDALDRQIVFFDVWADNVTTCIDVLIERLKAGKPLFFYDLRNFLTDRQRIAIISTINDHVDGDNIWILISVYREILTDMQEHISEQMKIKFYKFMKKYLQYADDSGSESGKLIMQLNQTDQLVAELLELVNSQDEDVRFNGYICINNIIEAVPLSDVYHVLSRLLNDMHLNSVNDMHLNSGRRAKAANILSGLINKIPKLPVEQARSFVDRILPYLDDHQSILRYSVARSLCAVSENIPVERWDKFIKCLLGLSESGERALYPPSDDGYQWLKINKAIIPAAVVPVLFSTLREIFLSVHNLYQNNFITIYETLCELLEILPYNLRASMVQDIFKRLANPQISYSVHGEMLAGLEKFHKVFTIDEHIIFIDLLKHVLLRDLPDNDPLCLLDLPARPAIRALGQLLNDMPNSEYRENGFKALQELIKKESLDDYTLSKLMEYNVDIGIDQIYTNMLSSFKSKINAIDKLSSAITFRPVFTSEMRSKVIDALINNCTWYDDALPYCLLAALRAYKDDMNLAQVISVLSHLQTYLNQSVEELDSLIGRIFLDVYETYRNLHAFMLLQRVPNFPVEMAAHVMSFRVNDVMLEAKPVL